MKLKDFIETIPKKELDKKIGGIGLGGEQPLRGADLLPYKEKISECEEFENCEIIGFVDTPIVKASNGKVLQAQTVKVGPDLKFKGRCFILSISFTPEIFDPKDLTGTVKDNAAITPLLYDPKDFTPYMDILLRVSPEKLQDDAMLRGGPTGTSGEITERGKLHKLLDKILDDPKEYIHKGKKELMVRGFFEIDNDDQVIESDFEHTKKFYYEIFYLRKDKYNKEGEVGLTMATVLLPKIAKDTYIKKFGKDSKIILEDELKSFQEEYNIEILWP